MNTLAVILLFLGLISFCVAAVVGYEPAPNWRRLNLIALGLAFWIAAEILRSGVIHA